MTAIEELRRQVYNANMALVEHGLVLHTFGNASGIDRHRGVVAIKPSGVPYSELTPNLMVLVGLDGGVVEGDLNPSSDTKTHLVLYRNFPGVGGVAHTHSSYATAWAQARRPIPCLGTTHADHLPCEIPCTRDMTDEEIGGDYETATGAVIVERFRELSYGEVPMALVASHGPFTWGESPEKAVYHSVVLEELAKTALMTMLVDRSAGAIGDALHRRHFTRKHGDGAYYGQE